MTLLSHSALLIKLLQLPNLCRVCSARRIHFDLLQLHIKTWLSRSFRVNFVCYFWREISSQVPFYKLLQLLETFFSSEIFQFKVEESKKFCHFLIIMKFFDRVSSVLAILLYCVRFSTSTYHIDAWEFLYQKFVPYQIFVNLINLGFQLAQYYLFPFTILKWASIYLQFWEHSLFKTGI